VKFYDGQCPSTIDVLKDIYYLREGLQRIAEPANGQYLHINSPRIPEMSRTYHSNTMGEMGESKSGRKGVKG